MKPGSAIGMTLCIAISSAAGAVVGAFVLPLCPPFVMVLALAQASIDDDASMRSLHANLSLLWEAAVVGACIGALLAWFQLRGRARQHGQPEAAAGAGREAVTCVERG